VNAFALLLALLLQLLAVPALAQQPREPIDVERFKPATTHDGFVVTEGSATTGYLRDDPVLLGVDAHVTANPLVVYVPGEGVVRRIVEQRAGFDLIAAYAFTDRFEIGASLPLFAAQAGDGDPNPAGLGDLRIVPKLRLLGGDEGGLALLGEVRLPTHSDDEFSGGARSPIFAPRVALDQRFAKAFRVGGNLGVVFRETTRFRNVVSASELTYSAALSYTFGGHDGDVGLGVDLHGGVGLAALQLEEAPLEGQLYASMRFRDDLTLRFGPSAGLVPGFGTPNVRVYVGLNWAQKRKDCITDGDGCPPCDDVLDPDVGLLRAIVVDEDDEPIRRSSARVDEWPATTVGPGIHEIRVEPGEHTLWVRARGYVPQAIPGIRVPGGTEVEEKVVMEPIEFVADGDKLEYNASVYFAFDSSMLLRESLDVLDELARVLETYPALERLSVQGHTDQLGPEEYNQGLSERRAAAVVAYLLDIGIEPDRLESIGFGETRPISDVDRKNRRVEFVIVEGRVPGAKVLNRDDREVDEP